MFLRFQRIALDVSYGFGRNRLMFLIVVFLTKKACTFKEPVFRKPIFQIEETKYVHEPGHQLSKTDKISEVYLKKFPASDTLKEPISRTPIFLIEEAMPVNQGINYHEQT